MVIQIVWAIKSKKIAHKWKKHIWAIFVLSVIISSASVSLTVYSAAASALSWQIMQWRAEKERVDLVEPCEAGDSGACIRLAGIWMWGTGGPVDVDKSVQFYVSACKFGNEFACEVLDDINEEGGAAKYYYNRRLMHPPKSSRANP